jgi:hypothetical protein
MTDPYFAYGLRIASEIPLPELERVDGEADVTIKRGRNSWTPPDEEKCHLATPSEIFFYWKLAGVFGVRGGQEIVADLVPDLEAGGASLVLLGPVLAGVLHQRGFLVLHASAVEVDGRAVLFVGDKGQGKSTMAVAMREHGYRLIADDVVAIDLDTERGPHVIPSFPQAKLWPNAAAALGLDNDRLPRLHHAYEKRAYRVASDFPSAPVPLARIYALTVGDSVEVEVLSPLDAVVEVVRSTYLIRYLAGTGTTSRNLRQSTAVAALTRPALLKRPDSLAMLPDVVRAVRDDVMGTIPVRRRERHA